MSERSDPGPPGESEAMSAADRFREAMSRFPTGVVIAAVRSPDGAPQGFTASAFTSVSLSPPMVLVCLATRAACHQAFLHSDRFSISILGADHEEPARLFATSGADKFSTDHIIEGADGLPLVRGAAAALTCRKANEVAAGDHTILFGEVENTTLGDLGRPLIHYRRAFATVAGRQAQHSDVS